MGTVEVVTVPFVYHLSTFFILTCGIYSTTIKIKEIALAQKYRHDYLVREGE